jgi:transposase-like protein
MSEPKCPDCPSCNAKGEFLPQGKRRPEDPLRWRCTGCGINSLYYPPPEAKP